MIDPTFLDELTAFATPHVDVHASRTGERRARSVGEGLTFADYRRYVPGDDPRTVDWKVYARTDELYVKQFEAERNLTAHVLLDSSASMAFGEGDHDKFEYAAKLGLGFAFLAARDHNDFRFSLFGDHATRVDADRSTTGEVLALVDRLNETTPDGTADVREALVEYADTIRSRALVLVASDFLCDVAALAVGLDALSRNRVVLAHVVAPEERDLPGSGDTIFEGLETPRERRAYLGARLRSTYRERLDAHVADVAAVAADAGADHGVVYTDAPFFESFADRWPA